MLFSPITKNPHPKHKKHFSTPFCIIPYMLLSKLMEKKVLIGVGPIRLILVNGRTVVFGPSAKMYGLPNGCVTITGPRRIVGPAKNKVKDGTSIKSIIYNRIDNPLARRKKPVRRKRRI